MNKLFKKIDDIIAKIPPHIQDIIQKASMAMVALAALIAILTGISRGMQDAKPGGFKLAKDTQELFYLEKLRKENKDQIRLKEDYDYEYINNDIEDPSENKFEKLSEDKLNSLPAESDNLLKKDNPLQNKYSGQEYLSDTPISLPAMKPSSNNNIDSQDILDAPSKEIPNTEKSVDDKENNFENTKTEKDDSMKPPNPPASGIQHNEADITEGSADKNEQQPQKEEDMPFLD